MSVAIEALSEIRGQRRAEDLIAVLRVSLTDGDELLRVIRTCPADELPGLCRGIQKSIEQMPRGVR